MAGFLTDSRLTLLRRAGATGHVTATTVEEKADLDDLVAKNLICDGRLTEAGWRELREVDQDPWID